MNQKLYSSLIVFVQNIIPMSGNLKTFSQVLRRFMSSKYRKSLLYFVISHTDAQHD